MPDDHSPALAPNNSIHGIKHYSLTFVSVVDASPKAPFHEGDQVLPPDLHDSPLQVTYNLHLCHPTTASSVLILDPLALARLPVEESFHACERIHLVGVYEFGFHLVSFWPFGPFVSDLQN
tara:strand:- start:42 stop:404 length:363 start_codon:yes stop_codon:yes gene_type:complete